MEYDQDQDLGTGTGNAANGNEEGGLMNSLRAQKSGLEENLAIDVL